MVKERAKYFSVVPSREAVGMSYWWKSLGPNSFQVKISIFLWFLLVIELFFQQTPIFLEINSKNCIFFFLPLTLLKWLSCLIYVVRLKNRTAQTWVRTEISEKKKSYNLKGVGDKINKKKKREKKDKQISEKWEEEKEKLGWILN